MSEAKSDGPFDSALEVWGSVLTVLGVVALVYAVRFAWQVLA